MLRILDYNDIETIKSLTTDSILGTRIMCQALCYGFDKSFVDYWAGDGVIISKFDNTFTVKADRSADFNELCEFLDVIGAKDIVCDINTASSLGLSNFVIKNGYKFSGDSNVSEFVSEIDDRYISDLYKIISKAIPGSFDNSRDAYLSFLSDYMYRKNRGFSRACGVFVSEKLVSTALTSAESYDSAIISGVACDEMYRKSGYGKKTVLTLSSLLKSENKTPYVIALNEDAGDFYTHIGFDEFEKIAYALK